MRHFFGYAALVVFAFIGAVACQSVLPAPKSPAQAVFEAKGGELVAITLANQYKALPRCGPAAPAVCSQASVITLLQKAANATDTSLDAAQATVTDPTFKDSPVAQQAAVAAQQALNALTAITATLKVK